MAKQSLLSDFKLFCKTCLTIDIRDVNKLGLSKFRTGAENDREQTCYFNHNKKDRVFNRFLAIRKKAPDSEIVLSIVNLTNKSNKSEDKYYNIGDKLEEFGNVRIQPEQIIRKHDKTDDRRPAYDRGRAKQRNSNRRMSKKPRFLSR